MKDFRPDSTAMPTRKNFRNWIGHKTLMLTVLEFAGKRGKSHYWKCLCDCGETTHVRSEDLTGRRPIKSCGCIHQSPLRKSTKTHGMKNTPEYRAWRAMRRRCYNENYEQYHRYGGRGITVFEPWIKDFTAFYGYIGPRPSSLHSLDRKDNNGNYEPGNVRWATKKQQCQNTHTNVLTPEIVRQIRKHRKNGLTVSQITSTVGVNASQQTIYDVAQGKTWVDVE